MVLESIPAHATTIGSIVTHRKKLGDII